MKNFKWIPLLFLTGCAVGPDYQTPQVTLPSHYDATETTGELDAGELQHWWTAFNDPLLDVLIHEALSQNFDLRIAVEKIHEVRALYQIQAAELWPKVDLNGEVIRERVSQSLFDSPFLGPPVQSLYRVGFDASWEVDIFGKRRREKEAAYYEYEAEVENARGVYITLLSEVSANYIEMRAFQQKISLSERDIYIRKELLTLSESLFRAGLSSEIDVELLRIGLEEARAALPTLQTGYRQTLNRLAVLLGKPPESLHEEFTERRPIPNNPNAIPVGLPSDLLRRRPDIRQAERTLAAATANLGSAIADLFPRFSLLGAFGFDGDHANNWIQAQSRTWTFGPTMQWPILYFGRIRSNIRAQNSVQKQALLSYEQTLLTSLEDVENALIAYYKEEERKKYFEKQVEAAKRQYALSRDLYLSGLSDFSTFLEADQTLVEAETNLVNSEEGFSTKCVALYKALGGEW